MDEQKNNHTTRTVGLIPSPGTPAEIAGALANELQNYFSHYISSHVQWKVEIKENPLIGIAETVEQLLRETIKKRKEEQWDFALCLTDLPLYDGKDVVLSDVDFADNAAQISIPAFGSLPVQKRVKTVVSQLVKELYLKEFQSEEQSQQKKKTSTNQNKSYHREKSPIRKQFTFSKIRRKQSSDFKDVSDLHLIIQPRLLGNLKLLFGMAYANQPLAIMPSFKPVIAVAFATGAYGVIFPTLWKISSHMEITRLTTLMFIAIISIVLWIVLSHSLWEKPTKKSTKGYRRLYNHATILTLLIAVLFYYLILYILFLVTVALFISPRLFGIMAEMEGQVNVVNYLKLAWLAASTATLAGSIGAGMENSDKVQNITYGYRQRMRYKAMEREREKEEEQKEKGESDPHNEGRSNN